MTISISVGSGKGGTGKSVIITNLAYFLARSGRRVCLVDLDLGGADAHIMFGLFKPEKTLTDFLTRKIPDIKDLPHRLDSFYGLELISGSGDTLQTANMTYQEKQRLLRHLKSIDTDILLIDVGAGCSYHVLDFFMATDIQICVTCPEPSSIMDFYRFLQLSTIRKALSSFLSTSEVSKSIKERNFESLAEVFEHAEEMRPGAKQAARLALEFFNPLLVVNKVGDNARLNQMKLKKLVAKYLGIYLPELGEIPEDIAVTRALSSYLPVCEYAPESSACKALETIGTRLGKIIDLYAEKRNSVKTA